MKTATEKSTKAQGSMTINVFASVNLTQKKRSLKAWILFL